MEQLVIGGGMLLSLAASEGLGVGATCIEERLLSSFGFVDVHPVFTLLFDREGYSPVFFKRLWDEHRIAVITYRKNGKDSRDEALFSEQEVETNMGVSKIKLAEQETLLGGCSLREAMVVSPTMRDRRIVRERNHFLRLL